MDFLVKDLVLEGSSILVLWRKENVDIDGAHWCQTGYRKGCQAVEMPCSPEALLYTNASLYTNSLHTAVIAGYVTFFQSACASDLMAILGSRSDYLEVACDQCMVSWANVKWLGQEWEKALCLCMVAPGRDPAVLIQSQAKFSSSFEPQERNTVRYIHLSSQEAKLCVSFPEEVQSEIPPELKSALRISLWSDTSLCADTGWDTAAVHACASVRGTPSSRHLRDARCCEWDVSLLFCWWWWVAGGLNICCLFFSLFLKPFDVHAVMWPPKASDRSVLPLMVPDGPTSTRCWWVICCPLASPPFSAALLLLLLTAKVANRARKVLTGY